MKSKKIPEAAKKFLDSNDTGVVPKWFWYGGDMNDYDHPSYLAVVKGIVQFDGSRAQAVRWVVGK